MQMVHIEQGNTKISALELKRLADLYRCPVDDFFKDFSSAEEALVHLYDLVPDLESRPDAKDEIEACVYLSKKGMELGNLLGATQLFAPPFYSLKMPQTSADAVQQGTQIADQERKRLGVGTLPMSDMSTTIARQGIWASEANLPDEISGFFMKDSAFGLIIIVNNKHGFARKRFSYAHEYAHSVMDRERPVTVTARSTSKQIIEKRANAFAASLLMPKAGIEEFLQCLGKGMPTKQEIPLYDATTDAVVTTHARPAANSQAIQEVDVIELARHFETSFQASVYRLLSLGYISTAETQQFLTLEKQWSDKRHVYNEVYESEREPNHSCELEEQIERLLIEAIRRHIVNKDFVDDLLPRLKKKDVKEVIVAELKTNSN